MSSSTCNICHEHVTDVRRTECGHVFCVTCMYHHLFVHSKHRCPMCRRDITAAGFVHFFFDELPLARRTRSMKHVVERQALVCRARALIARLHGSRVASPADWMKVTPYLDEMLALFRYHPTLLNVSHVREMFCGCTDCDLLEMCQRVARSSEVV